MSNKKVLLLALICGLLTALAVNFYLQSVKDSAANVKTRKVAVAAVRIPARTLVTTDMITLKNVPLDFVHPSAVSESTQVVGQTSRAEIEAGEQILQTKLVPRENSGVALTYSVPLGMRAIAVAINEQSGVAGLLSPGDHVDVLGTIEGESQPGVKLAKTRIILQNCEVLASGRNYGAPDPQQGKNNQDQTGGSTVTLAVPASKMQYLTAFIDNGKITLALRSAADKSQGAWPPVDTSQLLK